MSLVEGVAPAAYELEQLIEADRAAAVGVELPGERHQQVRYVTLTYLLTYLPPTSYFLVT